MWPFSRTRGNRRLSPGQKLDVKLRSDQLRSARNRYATVVILAGLGTVLGLYVLWRTGEWSLDKFVYDNPSFAIEHVDVQTDGNLAPEQVRRWSGVNPGANLISLDLAGIKRNLELVSTIDSVSIERILPRTLKIRVTERHPVAEVNLLRTLPNGEVTVTVFQIDLKGYVMESIDSHVSPVAVASASGELPNLAGLLPGEFQPGHPLTNLQALAALRLINDFKHSSMAALVELQSVDVAAPGVLVATTGSGTEVTFALDHADQQLRRWRGIHDWGHTVGKDIATVDLAVGNNVPVKWTLAGGIPVLDSKPVKPLHNRRKNV